jgi:hypothetical protein
VGFFTNTFFEPVELLSLKFVREYSIQTPMSFPFQEKLNAAAQQAQ